MIILNEENAQTAKYIKSIESPEWGVKKFNYNAQPLSNGMSASTFSDSRGSAIITKSEYKYWEVVE